MKQLIIDCAINGPRVNVLGDGGELISSVWGISPFTRVQSQYDDIGCDIRLCTLMSSHEIFKGLPNRGADKSVGLVMSRAQERIAHGLDLSVVIRRSPHGHFTPSTAPQIEARSSGGETLASVGYLSPHALFSTVFWDDKGPWELHEALDQLPEGRHELEIAGSL